MTITVIGHLSKDLFHTPDQDHLTQGSAIASYGGILISVFTLSQLLGKNDRVVPVFGAGEEEFDEVVGLLKSLGNVDTSGVFPTRGAANEVHHFIGEGGERTQCSKNIAPPLPFAQIKPHLEADGVLINMVSGFDLTLETLDLIRMHVREEGIPIHFDFHSLTLGIDDRQRRFRRPLTDWRRWCFMINSIQMSREEAGQLTAERYDEETLINQLMPLMVGALLITRGPEGVTLVRQEHKKLSRHEIGGIPVAAAPFTTGCGDVFGAAYVSHVFRSRDPLEAAVFANRAAALKATFVGLDGLAALCEHLTSSST